MDIARTRPGMSGFDPKQKITFFKNNERVLEAFVRLLVAFVSPTISGFPTAVLSAAKTISNGL
jgi:hypothetical protein